MDTDIVNITIHTGHFPVIFSEKTLGKMAAVPICENLSQARKNSQLKKLLSLGKSLDVNGP